MITNLKLRLIHIFGKITAAVAKFTAVFFVWKLAKKDAKNEYLESNIRTQLGAKNNSDRVIYDTDFRNRVRKQFEGDQQ